MPSPVGHTLAGVCGFIVAQKHIVSHRQKWLLFGAVVLASLPDFDFLPGLLLGDPRSFHHQGTHSLAAVAIGSLVAGGVARRWKLNGAAWGIWAGGLYLSHVVLDLLVNDPTSPFGVQLFWPFSHLYFISPITLFSRFDYFDPAVGTLRALLSRTNFTTIVFEAMILTPFVGVAWIVGRWGSRRYDTKQNEITVKPSRSGSRPPL